ncbi:MAG: substrate-binding domain-containing protein [Acidobacteriota bacterium]
MARSRTFDNTFFVRLFCALLCLSFVACGDGSVELSSERSEEGSSRGVTLRIVSGSENKALEPLIEDFARRQGATIDVDYLGSVDISLGLEQGAGLEYDAVWPANSLWIVLGDTQNVVKHEKSILRSPVVFGVRKSLAQELGWTERDVRVEDVLDAAESGRLRFAMTSATQSNSGASAYFGFLSALAGSPEVLTGDDLDDATMRSKVGRLLRAVDRSSGSSGWLAEMFLERWPRFDAMVNYEAIIIETNRELEARGHEPLWTVYPVDGLTIADSPLGYVDKGDGAKERLFLDLQEYLLSDRVQQRISELGRRTGLVGLAAADPRVFRADWGIDTERVISPVPVPEEPVVRAALELYQTSLRKPSLTAYVLDFSGSMRGEGEKDLKDAMTTLLDPEIAKRYLLQPSETDIHIVVPFDGKPRRTWTAVGNDPAVLSELLGRVLEESSGGGTNIYRGTAVALQQMAAYEDRMGDYFPAVILMSDGRSQSGDGVLEAARRNLSFGQDVPIFTIAFGKADPRQLEALSESSAARSFDAKGDLVKAFRKAKGYN